MPFEEASEPIVAGYDLPVGHAVSGVIASVKQQQFTRFLSYVNAVHLESRFLDPLKTQQRQLKHNSTEIKIKVIRNQKFSN